MKEKKRLFIRQQEKFLINKIKEFTEGSLASIFRMMTS